MASTSWDLRGHIPKTKISGATVFPSLTVTGWTSADFIGMLGQQQTRQRLAWRALPLSPWVWAAP